jgi:hypothetical protein
MDMAASRLAGRAKLSLIQAIEKRHKNKIQAENKSPRTGESRSGAIATDRVKLYAAAERAQQPQY